MLGLQLQKKTARIAAANEKPPLTPPKDKPLLFPPKGGDNLPLYGTAYLRSPFPSFGGVRGGLRLDCFFAPLIAMTFVVSCFIIINY
jgi:hypothetical protein